MSGKLMMVIAGGIFALSISLHGSSIEMIKRAGGLFDCSGCLASDYVHPVAPATSFHLSAIINSFNQGAAEQQVATTAAPASEPIEEPQTMACNAVTETGPEREENETQAPGIAKGSTAQERTVKERVRPSKFALAAGNGMERGAIRRRMRGPGRLDSEPLLSSISPSIEILISPVGPKAKAAIVKVSEKRLHRFKGMMSLPLAHGINVNWKEKNLWNN